MDLLSREDRTNPLAAEFGAQARREMLATTLGRTHSFRMFEHNGHSLRSGAADSVEALWLGGTPNWDRTESVQLIHRDQLTPCPMNPRRFVSREAMIKTYESIAAQGIHTPLDISQIEGSSRGLVLSGHRRLWVAGALDLHLLPCRLDPRGVLSELEVREAVIRYNEGAEKPAPIDRAQAIFEYIQMAKASQNEVAARFNVSPMEVSNMLRLLTLPEPVKEHVNNGRIPVATALVLARYSGGERAQIALAERVVKEKLSARQVRDAISLLGTATAIGRSHKGPSRKPDAPDARFKECEFKITGTIPAVVTISSNKAELSPDQVSEALREALMHIPVEMAVHHLDGTNGGLENPHPPLPASLASSLIPVGSNGTAPMATPSDSPQPLITDVPSTMVERTRVSAAAQSIRALFIDGRPDWSQPTVVQLIHRSNLVPHPANPRKLVTAAAMQTTLESIRQEGIHTPLHITRHPDDPSKAYILGGHRRLWCAEKLQLDPVPCRLDSRGVLSALQVRESLIRDNEGQERPAPIDRAISYAEYLKLSGFSLERAATRLGTTAAAIERTLKLLQLPPAVQDLANSGQLSEGAALAILNYPGGSEAQVALALKAVTRKLSVAQIKAFIGESRVSLAGLSTNGAVTTNTDRLWVTLGDRRVVVNVRATTGALQPTQLRDALMGAISQVAQYRGEGPLTSNAQAHPQSGEADTVTPILMSPLDVPLTMLSTKDPAAFEALARQYLNKFVINVADGAPVVAPDIALALQREVSLADLRAFELKPTADTIDNARKWLGLPSDSPAKTVRFFQILEYWGACLDHIRSFPPSKREFSYVELPRFPIDVECAQGSMKRGKVAEIIRARLECAAEVVERRLLTLIDAKRMVEASKSVPNLGQEMSREDLELRGIKLHPDIRWHMSFSSSQDRELAPTGGRNLFGIRELHTYFTFALRQLLELSGGGTEARVGSLELRRRHIAYSANITGTKASTFGWQQVFHELKGNIERLAQMLEVSN